MALKPLALAAALFWVSLAACSDSPQKNAETTPTSTTNPAAAHIVASVDWKARAVDVAGLRGYRIEFCEGAGPLLCVSKNGDVLGVMELTTSPGSFNSTDHFDQIRRDRELGCPGYSMKGKDTTATLAGYPGTKYEWTGELSGRVVERVIGVAAVVNSKTYALVMNALADDGCLNRESELPLESVDALKPALVALAEGSTNLPNP